DTSVDLDSVVVFILGLAGSAGCVLHHHHAISPLRNRRSGHDGHRFAGSDATGKDGAGFDLADDAQLRRGCLNVGRTDGISVTRGSGEGWEVAIGGYGFSQHASAGLKQGPSLSLRRGGP